MCDSNAIEVFRRFQNRYETRIGRAENQTNQIRIYRDWIDELTAQNRMLIEIVNEIERETVNRVDLFDSKVNEIVCNSQKSMIEMNFIGEFTGSLKNDLVNMVELFNRLMTDGSDAVFDDLDFTFTNIKDVLDENRLKLFPASNKSSTAPIKTKKATDDKSNAVRNFAQIDSDLSEKNQQLLNRIKFKDELINSMEFELDSLKKQNCLQNNIANFKSELKLFGEKYELFEASIKDVQNQKDNQNDLMTQKRDIIKLQKDTIEINQRNIGILVDKLHELKNQKDCDNKKINQFRDLLVNYQSLISDLENVLYQNKTKLLNMEKTVQLNKDTIKVLENSNKKYLNQLKDKNSLIEKLKIEIGTLQIDDEQMKNLISELENRVQKSKIETNNLNDELNNCRSQKRCYEEQNRNLQEMVRKTTEQINELLSSEKNFRNILFDFRRNFNCNGSNDSETSNCDVQLLLNQCLGEYRRSVNELGERKAERAVFEERLRVLELECSKYKSMYEESHMNELQLIQANESVRQKSNDVLAAMQLELERLEDENRSQAEQLTKSQSLCSSQETEIFNLKHLAHDCEKKLETSEKNRKFCLSKEKSLSRELNDRNNQIEKLSRKNRILEMKVSENKNSYGDALRLKESEICNLRKHFDQISQENCDLLEEKNDLRNLFEQLIQKNDLSNAAVEMENVMDHFDLNDAFSEYWLQKIKSISNELIKSNTFWRNQWTERKDSSSSN